MAIILQLLLLLLPVLYKLIVPWLENLQATGSDKDEVFLDTIYEIVRGIHEAHPDKSDDAKWQMAFEASKVLAADKGKADLRDSALDTLIAISVDKFKAAQQPSVVTPAP